MKRFITLREFCLLKDPLDQEPKRDTIADGMIAGAPFFVGNRGWSAGRVMVARYDIAKENWKRFGDEGPPIGSLVYTMTRGAPVILTAFDRDPRLFLLKNPNNMSDPSGKLVERTQWWVWMVPADHPVVADRTAYLRWENATK